ncbi:MAG TPA: hypothetical protein VIJ00_01585 [Nakamurella sp.]
MTEQETRIQQALRAMPSAGWLGRRDRALLVLSQMAGLPQDEIAKLTAGDVVIADGVATITAPTGVIRLAASGDGMICGPCALARWLHVLNLTAVYSDRCVIDSVIARGAPLSTNSPHLCDGTAAASDSTAQLLLLPPIDRWGLISAISAPRAPRDGRPAGAAAHAKPRPHRTSGTRNMLGH